MADPLQGRTIVSQCCVMGKDGSLAQLADAKGLPVAAEAPDAAKSDVTYDNGGPNIA